MASGAIKGITIEINGNTSNFQKSLSDANKAIKNTQKELKEVNKALKLDPKNVDLLRQKQDLLQKSAKEVSDRLDIEKKGLAELAKQDKTPEVTAKMRELERQIATDTAELKKTNKELKEFGSVGKQQAKAVNQQFAEVGKKISEVGDKVKKVGEGLTTRVTGPIVAVGGAAVAAFNEVDKAYDTVIKKTGATGEAAQGLYDIIDSLATSIPTDFDTAANAVGEVNTRFGVTGDELEELSEQFIKFSKLNNTDVSSSVDSVQKALSAFGLGADDAGALLDRLNKVGQDTGVSVDTLTAGLVQNGTAFQELGLDIDQSTQLMGQLEKSGANGETVMQGLRKALKSAAKDGKPLNTALEDLQNSIENGTDDMDGLTAAYELFGKSGDQIYGAIKNGTLDFRKLGAEAEDAAGSVSGTFEETLSPLDQWQMTLNELKLAGAEVGATIGEVLAPVLKDVADVIKDLKEKWEALSPGTQDAIVKAAGIAAVIGPIVAIVGSLISGIGGLITSLSIIGGVLGVAASTVGIVIAALVALGVAIGYCIAHWDEIKAKVEEVWHAIVDYVTQLKEDIATKFEEIKNKISEKLADIKAKFTEKFEEIKAKVKGVIDDIKGFFENLKLKIPKIELPSLPKFKIEGEFSLNPPSVPHISVDWNAKAMGTPYLFTSPTLFGFGAGEAGAEVMYGKNNLMRDIATATAANNEQLVDGFYSAMVEALKETNLTVQIGRREFGRIVREVG